MARIPSGVLGAMIGKVGPVSGYFRNGENIIRTAAKRKDPKITPLRTAQRQKIKLCNDFTRAFSGTGFFNKTFPAYGSRGTGYNRATSALLSLAIVGEYPDTRLSWPDVLISKGRLPGARSASASRTSETEIHFSWQNNSEMGTAKETDKVVLVAYIPSLNKAIFSIGDANRKSSSAVLRSEDLRFAIAEIWIGFLSDDEKEASDSVWVGRM